MLPARDVEVGDRALDLDQLGTGRPHPLGGGAVGEDPDLMAAGDELAGHGELRRSVAAEGHQRLQDLHAILILAHIKRK